MQKRKEKEKKKTPSPIFPLYFFKGPSYTTVTKAVYLRATKDIPLH